MIIVNERPCNGVDLSHWNGNFAMAADQSWLKFFGHKATHPNGSRMINGIDPKFAIRRTLAAEHNIRWRAFYSWIVPSVVARPSAQVALLSKAIGELQQGESVYLDWEDKTVPLTTIDELSFYMDLVFPGRWFMYVNDSNAEMTSWMESNVQSEAVPVMHPNYNLDLGLIEARKWKSMVWQTGTGVPPGFTGEVPIDLVLQPDLLDWICGRS